MFYRHFRINKGHTNILSITISKFTSQMAKFKVFVTRNDIPPSVFTHLNKSCEVTTWKEEGSIPKNELIKNIKDKDGLFCFLSDKIDKDVLENANSLKVIATMSVGLDHIDTKETSHKNIRVGYTPGVLTHATAELTVALLLATSRRLIEASKEVATGGWKAWAPFWMCGPGLKNKTIGIVGFGRIGQEVASMLKAFKVNRIIFYNRNKRPEEAAKLDATQVDFDTVLKESDFVIVTIALTDETRGLFSKEAFQKMKKSAVFVNTSRGPIVDQNALVEALKNGTILAAGLDVMDPEPLPLDSPLLKLNNCVLLPHIGSAANETRLEMAEITANNILSGLEGKEMPAEFKI